MHRLASSRSGPWSVAINMTLQKQSADATAANNAVEGDIHEKEKGDVWYPVVLDVDKSKFFDPRYAVLEGDIQAPVAVSDDVILKRGERCFVMVRHHVDRLYAALVPSQIAEERRQRNKPFTTGWLRHELYGLQVVVRLPLGDNDNKSNSNSNSNSKTYLTHNKRGIKCLDLPGEFVGIVDPSETDSSSSSIPSSLSPLPQLPVPVVSFSADQDDILTIQQSELKERLTRHTHFAKWLVATFGMDRLNSGTGVLDVAGGNGKLSLALHKLGIQQCTIVDPNPLCEPRPGIHIVPEPLEGDGSALTGDDDKKADNNPNKDDNDKPYQERIRNCSIVVGLHPDEATEAIVDLALKWGKPFAVSPCCVMTKVFPHRKHSKTGDPVRTVHSLFRYLLDKAPSSSSSSSSPSSSSSMPFQVDFLPFAGRNKVLYWKGPSDEHGGYCQPIAVPEAMVTVTKSKGGW